MTRKKLPPTTQNSFIPATEEKKMQNKKSLFNFSPLRVFRNTTALMGASLILGDDMNIAVAVIGPIAGEIAQNFIGGIADELGRQITRKFWHAVEAYRKGDRYAIDRFLRELKEMGLIAIRLPRGKEKKFLNDKELLKPKKPIIIDSLSEAGEWAGQAINADEQNYTPVVKTENSDFMVGHAPSSRIKRYLPSDMDAEIEKIRQQAA